MTVDPAAAAERLRLAANVGLDEPIGDILEFVERSTSAHVYLVDVPQRSIDGACFVIPGDTALIFLSQHDANGQRRSPLRQRFTLAHELGHFVLRHGTVIDHRVVPEAASDDHEGAANAFAGQLLMPAAGIERWLEDEAISCVATADHLIGLAARFGISIPAAWVRLSDEDLFAGERAKSQLWQDRDGIATLRRERGLNTYPDTLQEHHDARTQRIPPALTTRVDVALTHELLTEDQARNYLDGSG